MKKVNADEMNTTVAAEAAEEIKAAPVKKTTRAKKAAADTDAAEKKAPAKKRTTKKTAEAAAETAAEEVKEAPKKTAAKKAPAKKTAKASETEVKASVSVQFFGKEYTTEDLVEIAKAVWQYDLGQKVEDFKTVELYVKTEESAVYYVINGSVTGNFAV